MNRWRQVDPLMLDQGEKVLRALLDGGYQAFFVGGCVRDELMGRPVHDMDIATSAKPEEVISLFDRTVPTGIQHGTVTVLMEPYAFEVTTFRKESRYEDHRRPVSVEFVDAVKEDLQRRDFTMNAIARGIEGELTDPFMGRSDIGRGLIRCVGVAEERFEEDALRMMRAIRFAAAFGFRPVKSLWKALLRGRDKLAYIATERVRMELEKIVLGADPLRGLALLERSGLLRYAKAAQELPEPQEESGPRVAAGDAPLGAGAPAASGHSAEAALMRRLLQRAPRRDLLAALPLLPAEPSALRWSLLLQGLGAPGEGAAPLLKSWTFPNQTAQEAAGIVRFDEAWQAAQAEALGKPQLRRGWIGLQVAFGRQTAALWLLRQRAMLQTAALGVAQREAALSLLELAAGWHREVPLHTLPELAVNGGEVLQITGRKGGPWLGELMKELLLAVAVGELPNERQVLLDHVEAMVKEDGSKPID
ncbi:CCA tRNA nucleotidyltransferase [Paenibacillus macerans]|uniref:CCA tRNA nucleotidyltransferase n=1 Tax=Paenibacillus macerans TaxID=44252 RepID=UPI003D31889C